MKKDGIKTIYLSGPIMDESAGYAREWRETAKTLLKDRFRLLDPKALAAFCNPTSS